MEEDDPKEYRWESGYEKTWLVNYFKLLIFAGGNTTCLVFLVAYLNSVTKFKFLL